MTIEIMHIGFDDTDSPNRGCTTYIAAILVEELTKIGAQFIDYPNLIRLNPNVPWKTRGNGALCLRIRYEDYLEERIRETVLEKIEENADLRYEGTDPGVVFFKGMHVPHDVVNFSKEAITGIVTLRDALRLLKKFKIEAVGFKKARGIIGGLAAVGELLRGDYTFEIIAYRKPENYGKKRQVVVESVMEMNKITAPYTFNNIDFETGRVLITPRGADPVLFAIRGETPEIVKKAFEIVTALEPIERWVIFRTNHGTDAHLMRVEKLSQIKPYHSIIAEGIVVSYPKIVPRRHVIFSIDDGSARVDCAAYAPTGILNKVAGKLIPGDRVEVYGAVRPPSDNHPITINLEKIRILELAPKVIYQNPLCQNCGKRLKSMGKNKGFKCEKCGSRYLNAEKVKIELKRDISCGLYVTSPRSQRHLTKPLERYGREKFGEPVTLIDKWHNP
ncbi:MAG: tRNA(Ile)(2)-agmatinylcytidine synthase [Candidatus Bathyarchaeia archaeon]